MTMPTRLIFPLPSLVTLATVSTLLIYHHTWEMTLERRGRRLLKRGGGDDEEIPTTNTSPVHHEEQVDSTKKKDDEIRIGPITRARAKLIEQQVNSLLIDSDILCNENFILPKSLYVCIIRYHDEEEDPEGGEDEEISNFRTSDTFRTSDIGGQELRCRDDLELQKGYGTPTSFGRPTRRTSDMEPDVRHQREGWRPPYPEDLQNRRRISDV